MTSNLGYKSLGHLFKTAAIATLICGGTATGAAPTDPSPRSDARTPPNEPTQLPPELQAIQRSLGGSSLNQFPSLRDEAGPFRSRLQSGLRERSAARSNVHRDAIRALRDAATQLDGSANRLESLELYAQADAMRQLAQQMRIDARGLTAGSDLSVAPTPAAPQGDPVRERPQLQWDHSMPQFQPSPPRDVLIVPRPQIDPADAVAPAPLEPMPEPENRDDRPKPQPLLDSPEASPKPDVEIEG